MVAGNLLRSTEIARPCRRRRRSSVICGLETFSALSLSAPFRCHQRCARRSPTISAKKKRAANHEIANHEINDGASADDYRPRIMSANSCLCPPECCCAAGASSLAKSRRRQDRSEQARRGQSDHSAYPASSVSFQAFTPCALSVVSTTQEQTKAGTAPSRPIATNQPGKSGNARISRRTRNARIHPTMAVAIGL